MTRTLVALLVALGLMMLGAIVALVTIRPILFPTPEPYGLQGDRLGMSLADFKQHHSRTVAGEAMSEPCCSDAMPLPESISPSWHAQAGIVTCSLTFSVENDDGNGPTVGGFSVDKLEYSFVDGRLYQITLEFHRDKFEFITSALIQDLGKPHQVGTATNIGLFLEWDNHVSRIDAEEFAKGSSSAIILTHVELSKLAASREPTKL